jgi:serine/threonine protein kinase
MGRPSAVTPRGRSAPVRPPSSTSGFQPVSVQHYVATPTVGVLAHLDALLPTGRACGAAMDMQTGTTFAGYTVLRPLGSGGMGSVYLVQHPRLPRQDAMKVIHSQLSSDPMFVARFNREAELACTLDHPSLVKVYDRGLDEGRLWLTMQYIPGPDVDQVLRQEGPLDPARAVWLIGEIAGALDHVHGAGLVHRDVKPANILLARTGVGVERAYLTDFGIAHATQASLQLTDTGDLLASLPYAAPEQLEGRPVTGAVDVYALGCVLYELVTGRRLFDQSTPTAIMGAVVKGPPPEAFDALPPDRPGLRQVVWQALAERPADRFPTCGALADAARRAVPAAAPTVVRTARQPAGTPGTPPPTGLGPPWPPQTTGSPPPWPPQTTGSPPPWPPPSSGRPERPGGADGMDRRGEGAGPGGPGGTGGRTRQRRYLLWGAAVLALVVALGGVAGWLLLGSAPDAPRAVEAAATAEGVEVRWEAVDGATGYEVYRDGEFAGRSDGSVYVDSEVGSGVRATYSVRAVGDGGDRSALSESRTVVSALHPVSNLVPEVDGATVGLTWTPVENAETYEVRRDDQVVQSQLTGTSFTDDEALSPGSHTYTVAAFDADGAPSSTSSVAVEISPWLEAADLAAVFPDLVPSQPGPGGWGGATCEISPPISTSTADVFIVCNLPSGIYVELGQYPDEAALNERIAALDPIADPAFDRLQEGGWYRQSQPGVTEPAWEAWGFVDAERRLMDIYIEWYGHTLEDLDREWFTPAPWR